MLDQAILISQEEKEEIKFVVEQSKKNIDAWKSHLLRSVNQEEGRIDMLNTLDSKSVLVILDWAMKFIPRKYRESQTDWFGKRGISWHISVAMRKLEEDKPMQMLTFVHLFQKSNQDSFFVLAVIDDVIQQLKQVMPQLKSVKFRQDNAGCYHSGITILGLRQLAKKHNVDMRMDFSDPQGGKGPCDRKAATVKNHLRSYLNSGNDISNAAQMKTAIESVGGVRSVRAVLCGPLTIPDAGPFRKWDGVSFINDIEFKDEHMKVWRAYGVGVGKEIPYSNFQSKMSPAAELFPSFSKLEDASDPNLTFCDITPRHIVKKRTTEATAKSPDESSDTDNTLFTCSEEGCVKTFQRFSSLQSHLDIGKHKYALERESLLDKAMLRYAENLESGESSIDQIIESASGSSASLDVQPSPIGWALKSSASRRRLTKNQKKYLTDIFLLGEQTRQKADPDDVSKSMRKARDTDGSSLFKYDEYLTSKQIASFFSRLSSKKSVPEANSTSDNDDDDDEDDNDNEDDLSSEKEYYRIRDEVLNEISLKHPIIYDSYNICDMAATSKLSKFSIAMLQEICRYFELDISSVKQKRKKPYVDLLVNLVQSCTCNSPI